MLPGWPISGSTLRNRPRLGIVEARVVVIEPDGIEALLAAVAAVAQGGVDAEGLGGGERRSPARAVALPEVGIGQALYQVPAAVGDGDGAAEVIGDGVEPLGLGPAGVDDRNAGQGESPSDTHAAVDIEALGTPQVGHGLAEGAGDGLADAPVAGTVAQGERGAAAGDGECLAEGTPGEAAPVVFRHLATRVVGIPAAVAVDCTHRMRAGTVRAIGVDAAGAPAAGPGAVAASVVAVAAGEAHSPSQRNINRV